MTQRHVTEVRSTPSPVEPARQAAAPPLPQHQPTLAPLRFAVSLTTPQGREVFRKQFAAQSDADSFAAATAELCPEYKVAWVDRIDGFAWERCGNSVSVTASPALSKTKDSEATTTV